MFAESLKKQRAAGNTSALYNPLIISMNDNGICKYMRRQDHVEELIKVSESLNLDQVTLRLYFL